jgi:hypothetical protein
MVAETAHVDDEPAQCVEHHRFRFGFAAISALAAGP